MLSKILEAIYKTGFFHTNTADAVKLGCLPPTILTFAVVFNVFQVLNIENSAVW